ncbi:hypothetical protein [Paenibacillus sp. FSL K6-0108]|uniref:hypothetical protein n=1 Tax=Paenibacillus sp. FSL K6-0108 TaxID=2921417 RepID=UPI003249BB46
MAALDALVAAEYIHWDDKSDTSNIVILEGWEREGERPKVDHKLLGTSTIGLNIKGGTCHA